MEDHLHNIQVLLVLESLEICGKWLESAYSASLQEDQILMQCLLYFFAICNEYLTVPQVQIST